MEQLYRDFTVCKKCGSRCYLGHDYCEDCANEMWQKLKEWVDDDVVGFSHEYANQSSDWVIKQYDIVTKMKELEKEKVKSE